jgi:hypothetical protein
VSAPSANAIPPVKTDSELMLVPRMEIRRHARQFLIYIEDGFTPRAY